MSVRRLQSRIGFPAALIAVAFCTAAPASADVGETIIQRCTHGEPLSGFSQSAYQKALKELSADAEEYTNCSSLIRQAQLAAAGRGGAGALGGAEGAAPLVTSPAEQRAIARAASSGSAPVNVGGQVVHPGVVHANIASALSSLPSPLLAMLAFLLACLLLIAGNALRSRFRGRGSD
ncbi:MAG TPA: hypothetical protein VKG82_09920 [Solirubrobacteraceae bacterium]|nr:hypothetical protein [Solirubrobacteraceae bacterium]